MNEIFKLRIFYKLKLIKRFGLVKNRKESPAEHSWSSQILADYCLSTFDLNIDRTKVYELLMYHDVVEIYAGDTYAMNHEKQKSKQERELKALKKIISEVPKQMGKKIKNLFKEFEENKTPEAKFAKAMDILDGHLHELDYKEDWKGWNEEDMRIRDEKYFKGVPNIYKIYEDLIDYLKKNNYISSDT